MKRIPILILIAVLAWACSTTRALPEGEYRLARNYVDVENKAVQSNDLMQYIQQKPNSYWFFGWNPFLNVYNWTNGDGKCWSRFCEKIGVKPVSFESSLVSSSEDNIGRRLEYMGYYGSSVSSRVDTVRRLVRVHYNVQPGHRFKIGSVQYLLPEDSVFRAAFYADTANISIRPNSWLSEQDLEKESTRGAEYFRSIGYYDFNKNHYFFQADTLTMPGHTLLSYEIRDYTRNEGPSYSARLQKFYFGEVNIMHSDKIKFRSKILKGLNMIKPGELYDPAVVNKTYTRLSALNVFNSVQIEMNPVDSNTVDCNIKLTESKTNGVKVNLEASTNVGGLLGISPQVSYYNKNIFHGGEWLTIGFNGDFQMMYNDPSVKAIELGVQTSLSLPKFLGIPYKSYKNANIPRTEFKLSYNYQDRPEYLRHIASFSFGYTGKIVSNHLQYQLYPQSFNYVKLTNMSEDFSKKLDQNPYMKYSYQDHFDSAIAGALQYSTSTELLPKTSYFTARLNVDLAGNVISVWRPLMDENDLGQKMVFGVPYTQYSRGELNLYGAYRWGKKNGQAFAARLTVGAGYAYGNSTVMPFDKQFYVGGANSMRAWQSRSLGPGSCPQSSAFSIPSQSGDFKLELDLEYRFAIVWKLEGALFAEAGNVWVLPRGNEYQEGMLNWDNFFQTIALDWGAGIRFNLNIIVIRFDWGFKVYNPSSAAASNWVNPADWWTESSLQFGVGYPF